MRYFCHFLTAVLYAATVYLFIVTPNSMSRRNKMMLLQGGRVFFTLLFFVSVSYDRLHFYPQSVTSYDTAGCQGREPRK